MKAAICAIFVSLLLTASGCGSNGDGSGSEDDSAPPEGTTGGTTSDGSTETYRSELFLGGAEVTLEDGWYITLDGVGHLAAAELEDPDYRVMFSLDPYAIEGGKRVKGVPATASGLFDALRSNPNLDVGKASQESIGASPAEAADISASAEAVNDDPGCPEDVCVLFIAFPPAVVGESYGLAGDDVYRVYLSDLADGGQSHVLMVSVEARDAADLEEFLPAAERIIASARIVEDSEG